MVCCILNPEQGVCPLWPSDFLFAIADVLRWWPSTCHHRGHRVIAMPSRDVFETAGCPCCKQTVKPSCSTACEEMRETCKHAERPRHAGQKYWSVQAQPAMYSMLCSSIRTLLQAGCSPACNFRNLDLCSGRTHGNASCGDELGTNRVRSVTPCARGYCYCWLASCNCTTRCLRLCRS